MSESTKDPQGTLAKTQQGLPSAGQQSTGRGGILPWIARLLRLAPAGGAKPQEPTAAGSAAGPPRQPGMGNLRRRSIEDVAIPKADIVAVPSTITRDGLLKVFKESGLTRLPVYEGTLDRPIGFVHLKDFALRDGFNGTRSGMVLKEMLRPLLFVPHSVQIAVLLGRMQAERRHMALVIDEYGGVDGLVTIEDLIEEIIGEIEDEHDIDHSQSLVREGDGSYQVLAKTSLSAFKAETGVDLTAHAEIDGEEVDTLGGLVSMLIGRVPIRGEVVRHPAGAEFTIIDADPRRIKRLRVRLAPHAKA